MSRFLPLVTQAFRRLRRVPGFTLLCVLTLSMGVGSTTAIFSVVNGVLLSPLPYPDSERLVGMWHVAPGLNLQHVPQSISTYILYSGRSRTLENITVYTSASANLTGSGAPERLPVAEVTASLFTTLQVFPQVGRAFTEDEERPGAQPVVLLSDRLWKRRFGADPEIQGRRIRIDGVDNEVVGVMRPGFEFPSRRVELWRPLTIDPANTELGNLNFVGVGRLASGASIDEAQTELNQMLANLERAFPGDDAAPVLAQGGFASTLNPLRDDVVGDVGNVLWILLAAVAFILLIACMNVANLLIVRGEEQRRETALRTALGESRIRLISAALAESLLLGLAAGAAGLLLAFAGLKFLLYLSPANLPRLDEVGIDGTVLAFAAVVSILTSALFGLFPALRSTLAQQLATELRSGGRAMTMGHSGRRTRQLLVALQVALTLVLLTGSGLMLRSFYHLANVHPGFEPEGVLTVQLTLPGAEYPDDVSTARFFQQIVERLGALPGVESIGATSSLPFSGRDASGGHVIGGQRAEENAPPLILGLEYVTEGYFQTMGIPLLEGRPLERRDHEHRSGMVVVNQKLAKRFWPDESALGKRLRLAQTIEGEDIWYTVVGVVGNVLNRRLTDEPREIVYYPMLGQSEGAWTARQMTLTMRTRSEPDSLIEPVRNDIWSIAPNLPLGNVRNMDKAVRQAKARMTFAVLMFLVATAVALIQGAVGIYSFVSYQVSQRTPEIGIRMSIGGRAGDIRWMILKEAILISVGGIVVGLVGAVVLTRWLKALLFEVSPYDPLTFTLVPLVLAAIVVFSSYAPANRAARVDPVKALQLYN